MILPPLVFPGCMRTLYLLHSVAIQPNLELKTRNKQLLGYLTLDIALPRLVECLRVRPEPSFYYPVHGYILRLCPTIPESSLLFLPCRSLLEWSTLWCLLSLCTSPWPQTLEPEDTKFFATASLTEEIKVL